MPNPDPEHYGDTSTSTSMSEGNAFWFSDVPAIQKMLEETTALGHEVHPRHEAPIIEAHIQPLIDALEAYMYGVIKTEAYEHGTKMSWVSGAELFERARSVLVEWKRP